MAYKLRIYFSDDNVEEIDDVFETEQDALNVYDEWLDSWGAGAETLELAGEEYSDADIIGYDIDEI